MEGWADWRRTGYPILTPVNSQEIQPGVQFHVELIYPLEQVTLDAAAYKASSIFSMGGDLFTTKVWWDGGNK